LHGVLFLKDVSIVRENTINRNDDQATEGSTDANLTTILASQSNAASNQFKSRALLQNSFTNDLSLVPVSYF